jgi:PAS domain S-box-containing protein
MAPAIEGSGIPAQEEPLQTLDERFLLLAEAAPFFIWVAGSNAMFTYVNRAWLEMRGRRLAEETGNGWIEGLHRDDRDLCLEAFLKSFSGRQPFHATFRILRANGDYAWVDSNGWPCFEADSRFIGYLGSAVDVTDRRRAVFTPDAEAMRVVFALTERERQVLVLIANGQSTKESAAILGISYKTADSHRSRILEKLGVHETASMVRYAIRAGLINP